MAAMRSPGPMMVIRKSPTEIWARVAVIIPRAERGIIPARHPLPMIGPEGHLRLVALLLHFGEKGLAEHGG